MAILTCRGQSLNLRTYTTRDGLSNNQIRAITADSSGFLWIATWDGISRFDGYEFKNYYHIPGDSTSLPYFAYRDICVDGDDNIWVLSEIGHVLRYNKTTDKFEIINELSTLSGQEIAVILKTDYKNNLWLFHPDRITKRIASTGKTETYNIIGADKKPLRIERGEYSLSVINEDLIWITVDNTLYRLKKTDSNYNNEKGWIIEEKYTVAPASELIRRDYYSKLWSEFYETPGGERWLFRYDGLYRQDKDGVFREFNGMLNDYNFPATRILIWGDRNSILHIYDPSSRQVFTIKDEEVNEIMTCFVQSRNLIWISGLSSSHGYTGLKRIIITPRFFKNYQQESGIENAEAVYAIYKDSKGYIWTGIRGRDHIHVINPEGKWTVKGRLAPEIAPKAGHLRAIKATETGLWLGYYLGEMMFYDFSSEKLIRHHPDAEYCHTILPWTDSTVFIAHNNILIKYYPADRRSVLFARLPDVPKNIYCLVPDNDGNIWGGLIGSQVVKFNSKNGKYDIIKLAEEEYNVESICFGDKNDIWAALLGGGVCNYNLITGEKKYFNTSNGLSNNTTYSILKDKSGFIWVSTNSGISRIDPKTGLIRIFDSSDGQNITEFNSDAAFVAEDGEFLLGGIGGIVSFYPDSVALLQNTFFKQGILLTDFKVSGESRIFSKPLTTADTLTLPKGDNNFQINFSSSDFTNSEKTIYRYMLEGVEDKWTETTWRNRSVSYSNLDPRWYTFRIQATDRNGQWSASRELKIRIEPYFYQTRLFRIAVPLFVIAILATILIAYILHIRQKERMKQDELRLNALRGQMNPHFIFNSLNSINYFISNNDKLSANSYIADFSRLIRSILANLDRNYVPFETELKSLIDYIRIEHLRFGDKFDYSIVTEEKVNYSNMEVIPGLVQPFIENAIWHGIRSLENRKGFISVKFKLPENDRVKCIIEDDGIGRNLASEKRMPGENHVSKGISIVAERLRLLSKLTGKNFEFEITDLYPDREETGTRVLVEIPFRKK
ncbi:MAG: histidine kinase [Bacteroidales bacterium]|nr:histidine kinase [Bacteroidales bacterium]